MASVFDLQISQYGIDRGLGGANVARDYKDASVAYTPAWAEKVTGVKAADIERTGREFAYNASKTHGKSMVIMGAAINHWYHNDMMYRGVMNLLHMCGCVGQSGGGWAHYVGQEKLRPQAGWAPIAFATDWQRPPRHMNSTSYWYFHTDQWRYETLRGDDLTSPAGKGKYKGYSLADYNVAAVRMGWLPSAPHWNANPLDLVSEAEKAGATDEAEHCQARDRQAQGRFAGCGIRRPGQSGQLAAQPVRLARQPDRLLRQGARVLPQAPARRAERRAAGIRCRKRKQADQMARRSADRQAGPDGRHQLPPEFHRRLLRHRPADGDLVREERPQYHRHASLHASAVRGGFAGLAVDVRLADLQEHRQDLLDAGRKTPRHAQGHRRPADAARFALRNGPALRRGQGLDERRMRSDPRQDHAAAQGGRTQLCRHLQESTSPSAR